MRPGTLPEGAALCVDPHFARAGETVYARVGDYGWVEVKIPAGRPLPELVTDPEPEFDDYVSRSAVDGAEVRMRVPRLRGMQAVQAQEFGEQARKLADLMDFGHGDER